MDRGRRRLVRSVRALVAASLAQLLLVAARPTRAADEVIVFLVPSQADPGRVGAALEAIRAHLADVPARIVFEPSPARPEDLRAQVEVATQAGARHHAVGTFWLDQDASGDTLLYLAEPGGARVLVRHLEPNAGGASTVHEEVAVVTRSTVQALLDGGQIGMVPVEALPPEPRPVRPRAVRSPAPAAPAKPADSATAGPVEWRRDRLRLGVSWVGNTFAAEHAWQNGVAASVAVLPVERLYLGVGYTFLSSAESSSPAASVTVARHPIEMVVGYEHPLGSVAAGVELGTSVDVMTRAANARAAEYRVTADDVHVAVALSPRVRAAWHPLSRLALVVGVGPELVLNRSEYVVRTPAREELISPWPVRVRADAGVTAALW